MHDAFDQLLAAFAAALTLPRHMRFGAPVVLPEPQSMTKPGRHTESIYAKKIPASDELLYYMSLSCIPNVIQSCLFGSFWEPKVCCNVVSEWLSPPLQELLPTLLHQKQYDVVVQIMAARQPNLAPLWLGSAITGLLPRIPQIISTFIPPICLEATSRTESPQSFMDPTFHRGPHVRRNLRFEKVIPREDEFHLLYITDFESQMYGELPLSPYPPFGAVRLEDTTLEVKIYASCGHSLAYRNWVWQGQDGKCLDDCGLAPVEDMSNYIEPDGCLSLILPDGSSLQHIRRKISDCWTSFLVRRRGIPDSTFSEELSERATRNLFSWTFFSDGVKHTEKEIWRHEWLNLLLDLSDDDSLSSSSSTPRDPSESNISNWLHSISRDPASPVTP